MLVPVARMVDLWSRPRSTPAFQRPAPAAERGQILYALSRKPELFRILQDGLQTAGDEVILSCRKPMDKQTEDGLVVHLFCEIGLHHGQFIEVSKECNGGVINPRTPHGPPLLSTVARWRRRCRSLSALSYAFVPLCCRNAWIRAEHLRGCAAQPYRTAQIGYA